MISLSEKTGSYKMELDIQTKDSRGIILGYPNLNLKIMQLDKSDNIINTIVIPQDIMQLSLDKVYFRLVTNFKAGIGLMGEDE